MSESMDIVLKECLSTLKPYLDQLVLAGGWVPYIYNKKYGEDAVQEPLLTRDFDAAVPRHGFKESGATLNDAMKNAGFRYEFASLDTPPVVKYVKMLDAETRV